MIHGLLRSLTFWGFTTLLVCQEQPHPRDGRWWSTATAEAKLLYLTGVKDQEICFHLLLLDSLKRGDASKTEKMDTKQNESVPVVMQLKPDEELKVAEVTKVVETFYRNSANIRVPVVFAYDYSRRKVIFKQPADWLARYEVRLRKGASQLH